jgi:hypothetical protein
MFYNHIYNLQFKGNDQVGTDLYYQVKFEKQEATEEFPDVIELIPAQDSPFVLNYKASKDNIFAPIRSSYADIKCFIPYNSTVQPSDFFFDSDEYTWKISFYETNGVTETLKWRGFLLPDVIQYEWQEQYYLQLTATDNLAVLKDIKYTREDYYALYDDTNVDTGINISDFVCRLLKKTGSDLDVAFYSQFKINDVLYNTTNLKLSEYSAVDWSTFEPKDCYFLLTSLMESLGCMLYQSNKDATWYIVGINDLGVNDLVYNGNFEIDGSVPNTYFGWNSSGTIVNSPTGGLNGSQCPKIFGDNTSYVSQFIDFINADYIVGFWAKNDGNIPNAVVRVFIDGDVFTANTTNNWTYFEFTYNSPGGNLEVIFLNQNPDEIGFMFLDNVSIKQKFQNGLKYDINGTYLSVYTFNFYSSIGNSGNVKWSDVNQLVSLNKRLTNVQFKYPYYERNLLNNFGFFKDYATLTTIPTNWAQVNVGSSMLFANAVGADRPFDDKIIAIFSNADKLVPPNSSVGLYNLFRITNANTFMNYFAVKVECNLFFDGSHNPGDSIMLAFAKSLDGDPSTSNIRYLNTDGVFGNEGSSSIWNGGLYMSVPMSVEQKWQKYKCYSKFDKNSLDNGFVMNNWGTFIIRHQRSSNDSVLHTTYIDNIKLSIIPKDYQNTKGFIYNATNVTNEFPLLKPFTNTYNIDKGQYHGGITDIYESQVIEDFIGYTEPEFNLIQSSTKWLRKWETAAVLNPARPLQECITRSILSFYQATWQKFTGNVYGKDISFGQVFNIALAQGLHFMHEASFDYVNNKTNITTHQSQTNILESNFRSWNTTEDDMGAGQGQPGSTTTNIQEGE